MFELIEDIITGIIDIPSKMMYKNRLKSIRENKISSDEYTRREFIEANIKNSLKIYEFLYWNNLIDDSDMYFNDDENINNFILIPDCNSNITRIKIFGFKFQGESKPLDYICIELENKLLDIIPNDNDISLSLYSRLICLLRENRLNTKYAFTMGKFDMIINNNKVPNFIRKSCISYHRVNTNKNIFSIDRENINVDKYYGKTYLHANGCNGYINSEYLELVDICIEYFTKLLEEEKNIK